MKVAIIAFTRRGADLARQLCAALGPDCSATAPARYAEDGLSPLEQSLAAWTEARFSPGGGLVFVGGAGIAVRAIAPYVKAKDRDPAVVCVDEAGQYAIPLLSGHIGGANRLARQVAAILGGTAVITTATDVNGVFSPDAWAAENGCAIPDAAAIKQISAALLEGEMVGLRSDFPVSTALPAGVVDAVNTRCGMEISLGSRPPYLHTLHLIPRCLVAGIGCRRGIGADLLEQRLTQLLTQENLPVQAVVAVASIDLKADEPGLLELCNRLNVPLLTYSAAQLMAVEGDFAPSERVLMMTGADNVCQRAAVAAGGRLLTGKYAGNGVTVALSQLPWQVEF